MQIFGNPMTRSAERKARRNKDRFAKKFGFDPLATYPLSSSPNGILGRSMGLRDLVAGKEGDPLREGKSLVVGTIRMGYGHYRPAIAVASAAHSMGITPYWLDLLAFEGTPGAKIIRHLEKLYSLGSRLSQKSALFNRLYWEPLTAEGFKKLAYNASDRLMCELMAPIYGDIPKGIPVIGTHVWPAIAALHAGMERVVNMIPDNWPLGLHLAEGAIHAVQTPSVHMGYRTLKNMAKKGMPLNPIPPDSIRWVGHNIDHEIVKGIEKDCAARVKRAEGRQTLRVLISIGGAGAQIGTVRAIIRHLAPRIRDGAVDLFVNSGDHENVFTLLNEEMERCRLLPSLHTDWKDSEKTALQALTKRAPGVHHFYNGNIFAAVYATNQLMRASDILVTKPSELSFYPVPKLFIKRVGGHEAWGAIRSSEVGDGTLECETDALALQALDLLTDDRDLLLMYCENIIKQKKIGTYDGAYNVVSLAFDRKKMK